MNEIRYGIGISRVHSILGYDDLRQRCNKTFSKDSV